MIGVLGVVLGLLVCGVLWWGGIPPDYGDVRAYERGLKQHRWREVRVDERGELVELYRGEKFRRMRNEGNGTVGREEDETRFDGNVWRKVDLSEEAGEGYIRFPDFLWGHGFNNALEERCVPFCCIPD